METVGCPLLLIWMQRDLGQARVQLADVFRR